MYQGGFRVRVYTVLCTAVMLNQYSDVPHVLLWSHPCLGETSLSCNSCGGREPITREVCHSDCWTPLRIFRSILCKSLRRHTLPFGCCRCWRTLNFFSAGPVAQTTLRKALLRQQSLSFLQCVTEIVYITFAQGTFLMCLHRSLGII